MDADRHAACTGIMRIACLRESAINGYIFVCIHERTMFWFIARRLRHAFFCLSHKAEENPQLKEKFFEVLCCPAFSKMLRRASA